MIAVSTYIYPGLKLRLDISLESLLHECCSKARISVADIKGRSRKREIVTVRHVFCYLATEQTEKTLEAIGNTINRNHATVVHSRLKAEEFIETKDKQFMDLLNKITNNSDGKQ